MTRASTPHHPIAKPDHGGRLAPPKLDKGAGRAQPIKRKEPIKSREPDLSDFFEEDTMPGDRITAQPQTDPIPGSSHQIDGRGPEDRDRELGEAFTSDDEAIEAQEVGGGDDETDLTDEVRERDEDEEMLAARDPSVPTADPDQRRRPTDEKRRQDESDTRDG